MEKSRKFQGGGGSNANPSGMENPVGWGVKLEKNPPWGGGGYGYFLEPHIVRLSNLFNFKSFLIVLMLKLCF